MEFVIVVFCSAIWCSLPTLQWVLKMIKYSIGNLLSVVICPFCLPSFSWLKSLSLSLEPQFSISRWPNLLWLLVKETRIKRNEIDERKEIEVWERRRLTTRLERWVVCQSEREREVARGGWIVEGRDLSSICLSTPVQWGANFPLNAYEWYHVSGYQFVWLIWKYGVLIFVNEVLVVIEVLLYAFQFLTIYFPIYINDVLIMIGYSCNAKYLLLNFLT